MSLPEVGDVKARGISERQGVGVLAASAAVEFARPNNTLTATGAITGERRVWPMPAGPDTVVYESGERHQSSVEGAD
jgi:hypothetical protein